MFYGEWKPTSHLRAVFDSRQNAFLQQLWQRTVAGDDHVFIGHEDQWRVVPQVMLDDLTPEELGIGRFSDRPKERPSDDR